MPSIAARFNSSRPKTPAEASAWTPNDGVTDISTCAALCSSQAAVYRGARNSDSGSLDGGR